MKIKTSELSGTALNWAVAHAQGAGSALVLTHSHGRALILSDRTEDCDIGENYQPSINWAQGGPIIDREQIAIGYYAKIRGGLGVCATRAKVFDNMGWCLMYGDTPLIAAMRCFVASKLGDEVDVPDELNQGVKK